MFGPLLTPQEYDCVLTPEIKQYLRGIVRQPRHDTKGIIREFGCFLNGTLACDPIVNSITGFGDICGCRRGRLPITVVEASDLTK